MLYRLYEITTRVANYTIIRYNIENCKKRNAYD